jgi:hypothetical protein
VPGIARKAPGNERTPSHASIAGRRCLRARSKKTPGSDRMTDRFGGSIRGEGRYYLKDFHNPVTCTA